MAITNISQDGYYDAGGNWVNSGKKPQAQQPKPPSLQDYASQYAQQRQGYAPHRVMQEGTVTYKDGVPGVMIKYNTPQGSSTEWTPMSGYQGGANVQMMEFGGPGGGGVYGGGGGNGFNPGANPYYQQMKSLLDAQNVGDAASMRDSIRQMLIAMGVVPEGFKDQMGVINDPTLELIKKNTQAGLSTQAQLDEQKLMGIKNAINRLSARGLRRSGARGHALRKNQLAYDRNRSDVMSRLMQQIGGMYQGYNSNVYGRQAQLINMAMQLAQQYSGSYGSTYGGGGGGGQTTQASAPAYSQVADPGTFGSSQTEPAYNMGGGWWAM